MKIFTYPDPVLSQPAQEVSFPLSKENQSLIAEMWETVDGEGVGLAAPQVGASKQICIIHLSENLKQKNLKKSFVMINPKITFYSQARAEMIEGCLSFPDEYWSITRPANIMVEFYDETGKQKRLSAKGWLSRVIQHEVHHLNGKLFINQGGVKLDPSEISEDVIVD